jgi:hypothetical protein
LQKWRELHANPEQERSNAQKEMARDPRLIREWSVLLQVGHAEMHQPRMDYRALIDINATVDHTIWRVPYKNIPLGQRRSDYVRGYAYAQEPTENHDLSRQQKTEGFDQLHRAMPTADLRPAFDVIDNIEGYLHGNAYAHTEALIAKGYALRFPNPKGEDTIVQDERDALMRVFSHPVYVQPRPLSHEDWNTVADVCGTEQPSQAQKQHVQDIVDRKILILNPSQAAKHSFAFERYYNKTFPGMPLKVADIVSACLLHTPHSVRNLKDKYNVVLSPTSEEYDSEQLELQQQYPSFKHKKIYTSDHIDAQYDNQGRIPGSLYRNDHNIALNHESMHELSRFGVRPDTLSVMLLVLHHQAKEQEHITQPPLKTLLQEHGYNDSLIQHLPLPQESSLAPKALSGSHIYNMFSALQSLDLEKFKGVQQDLDLQLH